MMDTFVSAITVASSLFTGGFLVTLGAYAGLFTGVYFFGPIRVSSHTTTIVRHVSSEDTP